MTINLTPYARFQLLHEIEVSLLDNRSLPLSLDFSLNSNKNSQIYFL